MEVIKKFLDDVLVIKTKKFQDERGSFREQFNNFKFNDITGKKHNFVQDNISVSKKNVFRGFHYQIPFAQGKLISVLNGSIIDYFIDMRTKSKNFVNIQVLNCHRMMNYQSGFQRDLLMVFYL